MMAVRFVVTIYAESGFGCKLIYGGDAMDQIVYDRIWKDAGNPPNYHAVLFNSRHWVNNILWGGNAWQRTLAD